MSGPSSTLPAGARAKPEDISKLERIALGSVIRRVRRARGLRIEDLAHKAGIHPTYLSGIERGVRNPTWTKLCKLAAALEVELSVLAVEIEEEAIVLRIAEVARARLRARFERLSDSRALGSGATRGTSQTRLSIPADRAHR